MFSDKYGIFSSFKGDLVGMNGENLLFSNLKTPIHYIWSSICRTTLALLSSICIRQRNPRTLLYSYFFQQKRLLDLEETHAFTCNSLPEHIVSLWDRKNWNQKKLWSSSQHQSSRTTQTYCVNVQVLSWFDIPPPFLQLFPITYFPFGLGLFSLGLKTLHMPRAAL